MLIDLGAASLSLRHVSAEDLVVLASRAPETGVDGRRSVEQVAPSMPSSSGLRLVSVPVSMISKAASAGAADPFRPASVGSRKGLTLLGWSSSLHELGSDGLCLCELELFQCITESTKVSAPSTHSSASSLLAMRSGPSWPS